MSKSRVLLGQYAAGRVVGSFHWLEQQLFGVLGEWVVVTTEPAVKLFFNEVSFEHAWHASLWAEQLPAHRRLSSEDLSAPANEGVGLMIEAVREESDEFATVERLTIMYRVLVPRLLTAYQGYTESGDGNPDPSQRALRLVIADETVSWKTGIAHLEMLLVDKEAVERSIEVQRRFELMLVDGGGIDRLNT